MNWRPPTNGEKMRVLDILVDISLLAVILAFASFLPQWVHDPRPLGGLADLREPLSSKPVFVISAVAFLLASYQLPLRWINRLFARKASDAWGTAIAVLTATAIYAAVIVYAVFAR
ncbi:MAG: hypothetical protein U0795_22405 [Pirellulales bacterium]